MSFLGFLGKVAVGFVTGGPAGAIMAGASTLAGGLGAKPAGALATQGGTAIRVANLPMPVLRAPTFMSGPGGGTPVAINKVSGVNVGGPYGLTVGTTTTSPAGGMWPWSGKKKYRRMNYLNLKALKRASRRAHGFLAATRGVVRYYQPHAKKGRPYIAAQRKRKRA